MATITAKKKTTVPANMQAIFDNLAGKMGSSVKDETKLDITLLRQYFGVTKIGLKEDKWGLKAHFVSPKGILKASLSKGVTEHINDVEDEDKMDAILDDGEISLWYAVMTITEQDGTSRDVPFIKFRMNDEILGEPDFISVSAA